MSTPIPQRSNRICLADPLVALTWRRELNCTELELRTAVYAVGSDPDQIRSHFRRSIPEKVSMRLRRILEGKL